MTITTIQLPNTHTAYFLSDLHLSEQTPNILNAFEQTIKKLTRKNHHIFLLGDLFEIWVGDDNIDPIAERVAAATHQAQQEGCQIYFMHGNRDFLIATQFAEQAKLQLLPDPSFLKLPEHTVLLTHGDQLCTDDLDYQKFRLMSRSDVWKNQFSNMPLEQRLALANQMRQHSKTHKNKYTNQDIMDVNSVAVRNAMNGHWPSGNSTQLSTTIIHGHTHRCATHPTSSHTLNHQGNLNQTTRIVLPDWNENISSDAMDYPQNGFLELNANGQFKLHTNIKVS